MMWRKILSVVSMVALFAANSIPAVAADVDRLSGPQFNFSDQYRGSAEIKPGVYFQIPLSGNLRRSVADSRFGLTLSARLPGQYSYTGRLAPRYTAQPLDLSIGLGGRETIQLNGLSLADMTALYADEEGKTKDKKKVWPWVLGGALAAIAGIFVIFAASCAVDKCRKDEIICC